MKKRAAIISLSIIAVLFLYYFYPEPKLPADIRIDKLVVVKSERKMYAYANGKLVKTYSIALGRNPEGDKQQQGDKRTPEGEYTINDRNPNSGYHKNLGISYPDANDRKKAQQKGLDPGGDIKIHGLRNGLGSIGKFHRHFNWTAGCIAVTDEEIDELYRSVQIGAVIRIAP